MKLNDLRFGVVFVFVVEMREAKVILTLALWKSLSRSGSRLAQSKGSDNCT
jgi:hypothetical protein